MSDVIIDPDVLTDDAEDVWQDASDRVLAMKEVPPEIPVFDFCLAFDPARLVGAYQSAIEHLGGYLDGGSDEFLHFEKNLLEAVITYGRSHDMSAQEIAALEAEIDV